MSATAASQAIARQVLGRNPPTSTSPAEPRLNGASRAIAAADPGPPAEMNSPECTRFTIRYPIPNAGPAAPNALGIASAMTRNPPMPPISSNRRTVVSGATALVNQTYPKYIHRITHSMITACANPSGDVSSASVRVSCVIVKTKTRSKKSSSV